MTEPEGRTMAVRTGSLVQNLFAGPIDVVGDIHGEIEALQNLLTRLGTLRMVRTLRREDLSSSAI